MTTRWESPHARAVDIGLWGPQYGFVTDQTRFTSFIGGIGSGKTVAGAVKAAVHAQPGTVGIIIAPTFPMLRDATIRTFMDLLGPLVQQHHKSENRLTLLNGAEILLRSADQPDRLRGPSLHWAWIDEAAMCPNQTFEITIGRLRADGTAGPCWITGTPKGQNWVWQLRHLMRRYRGRTRDNPFLHRQFVSALEDSYVGAFAKQELEGDFVRFEGLIYDEFEESARFIRQRPTSDFVEIWGAGDEGYTNPQVFLVLGRDSDDNVHVLAEFYERKVRTSIAAEESRSLSNRYGFEQWYMDPSAAGLNAEMEELDLAVQPANNSVTDGIQSVKSLLAKDTGNEYAGLTIDPSCVWTISEMLQYVWKDDKKPGQKEAPVKSNDHAMDALRYGIHSHLGGLTGKLML